MYKEVTLFFSQDAIAMIAHVIPTMDWINMMLSSSSTKPLLPSIKHTLSFAQKIMDKYYSKTDLSNVYRIAMGMLPCCQRLVPYWLLFSSSPTDETQIFSTAQMV